MTRSSQVFGTLGLMKQLLLMWTRTHRILLVVLLLISIAATAFPLWSGIGGNDVVFALLLYLPFVVGLSVVGGIVSHDRLSGLTDIWFQQRGSLARTYSYKLWVYAVPLLVISLALAAIEILAGTAAGVLSAKQSIGVAFAMPMLMLIGVAMTFALSAWEVRRDSAGAVLIAIATVYLEVAFAFSEGILPLVISFIAFPVNSVSDLVGEQPVRGTGRAIGHMVGYVVAWTGIGFAGLLRLQGRIANGA